MLLLILVSAALLIKYACFQTITNNGTFVFQFTVWVGGFLVAILGLNVLWQAIDRRPKTAATEAVRFNWPNRRECYRVVYPLSMRPLLIIEWAGSLPVRHMEYPVADISEGGLCFLDDGTLATIEEFSGRLIFKQGTSMSISGKIVRRDGDRISIQLHRNLAWRTILKEQRNLINPPQ